MHALRFDKQTEDIIKATLKINSFDEILDCDYKDDSSKKEFRPRGFYTTEELEKRKTDNITLP